MSDPSTDRPAGGKSRLRPATEPSTGMIPTHDDSAAADRQPSLDVVIVNWNSGDQLAACLASLRGSHLKGFLLQRVVVVDNGSNDGSERAATTGPLPVTLLGTSENLGFAAAANRGAAGSTADYLFFFNPDACLEADTLARCVAAMESPDGRSLGVVGPQLIDAEGRVTRSCARFPTPGRLWAMVLGLHRLLPKRGPGMLMSDWDHATTRDVDHVMGAAYLIRRDLFATLGGFDERFFLYLEDLDLSLRARRAGQGIRFLADARAFHRGGGLSRQIPVGRLVHALQSRIIYGYKHFHPSTATALLLATLLIEPPIRLAAAVARMSPREFGIAAALWVRLLAGLPALLARLVRS